MHDRPLRSCNAPAALGLFTRKLDRFREPEICFEPAVDENPAPDHGSGFADSLDRPAAKPEIHRRLPLAHASGISINKMLRWNGAGYFEYPDEASLVILAVAQVVQSR